MAFEPQGQVSILDRLADETLQHILDFAMARDSPFYIDDPFRGTNRRKRIKYSPPPVLESSTGAKDPLFTGHRGDTPVHQHAPQSVHRTDWIAINSTSRRIRALGKLSFFKAKTIAMHAGLPARLQRNDFEGIKRMWPNDQALALSYIRDVVIVNARECAPIGFLQLPRALAIFPCLRRCTLLFGFSTSEGDEDDVEWITAAFALGGPVPLKMQELMTGVGMPRDFRLEEALGPGWTWAVHRNNIARYIYPMLGIKGRVVTGQGGEGGEGKVDEILGSAPKLVLIQVFSVACKWHVFGCVTSRPGFLPEWWCKVRWDDFFFFNRGALALGPTSMNVFQGVQVNNRIYVAKFT